MKNQNLYLNRLKLIKHQLKKFTIKFTKKFFIFFEKIKNSLFVEYKFFNTKNFFNHINLQFKL